MKKLYTMMMMAMMAVVMTSCESDEDIAYTLEGTWKGNMYISTYWDGRPYDATYTEVTFLKDPYRYSSGEGYWVDYYSGAPWDYVANHISWKVDWGTIYIYFREEGTSLEIYDYSLNANRFAGTIHYGDNRVAFELYNTSRPAYDKYRWGYDAWDYGYYSRTRTSPADTTVVVEQPHRYVRAADAD